MVSVFLLPFAKCTMMHFHKIFYYVKLYSDQTKNKFFDDALEPVCCKKWQKIVPEQLLVCGVGGPLKDLKDSKLILNVSKLFP